jgi:uncharacterized protein DUF3570
VAATRSKKGSLRTALVSACGVLGISGAAAQATEISSAVLGYSEPNRVNALEAVVDARHVFADGKSTSMRLVYDALTGASANGAVPSSGIQTFTRPSGRGSYETPVGETPLDDTFRDVRVAGSAGFSLPIRRVAEWSLGAYGSGEHDYVSMGGNTSLSRDFNKRNTTLALRLAYFHDTINPEGGRPVPLAEMAPVDSPLARLDGDGSKDVTDVGLGLTQVLDRATILHMNYTFSDVSGYQTDPYKLVSVVDGLTGLADQHLFESRPDARTKHVLFGELARHLGDDIVHLSYRYMNDDWGIGSHTLDLKYRWNLDALGKDAYLQPHVRFYTQGAADFYRRFLIAGDALPTTASADYRLGDMKTYTVGLKHGRKLGNGHELTMRFEYYAQTGDSNPSDAIGALSDLDLFPTVDAFIFQVGYSMGP